MRKIIDVSAPEGYEVGETTEAKNVAMDAIQDALDWWGVDTEEDIHSDHDAIGVADRIVEDLIKLGWRPTEDV